MPKIDLPFTGGYYVSRSLPISNQQCKNLYVHINTGGGLAPESLYGTPGSNQLATTGGTGEANRGGHVKNDVPYFVNGNTLYVLNRTVDAQDVETFNTVALGTIEGDGRVSMADNGTQLCILVPGGKGYIYNEAAGTPFEEITDVDFRANGDPQQVVYIDGFFLFTTDQKKIIISALNNGLAYNALDFGTAEADPDKIVAPIVNNNQLFVGGSETFESFNNVGGSGFPFQRLEGGGFSVGVFSPFSLINVSSTFMFVGGATNEAPSVYAFTGSGFAIVSSDAINVLLEKLTAEQLENVFAMSYSEGAARFVAWVLPETTIVYDLTSKRWHERGSYDIVDDVTSEFRWRANSAIKAYSRILIGDSQDGRIGEIDLDILDEYGQNILRTISSLPFSNRGESIKVPSIELTLESGVGNATVPDPVISMDRSKDGKTFSDRRTRRAGKVGEYDHRAIWRRNGRAARLEVFRWTMSDKVKWVLIKVTANIV